MGLRETINKNPQIATGVTVGLLLLAVVLIVWQLLPGKSGDTPKQGRLYFTIDDGKTHFEADAWSIAPFQYQGKEAVRAHVYRCGPNGKLFVGWMEKYSPESKKRLDEFFAKPENRGKFSPDFSDEETRMLKKPGEEKWKKWTFEVFDRYRMIKCGTSGEFAEEVLPPLPS